MLKELRPHQQAAISLVRQSLATRHKRPMLQAPTGFGKTLVAATIARGAIAKGNPMIFCVPAISLIDQTVEAFAAEGIVDVGVIQASTETHLTRPIQVASVQTLARRKIPKAGVVVIDEAHRWFKFFESWMGRVDANGEWHGKDPYWRDVPFIGLSATPWTRGLGRFYDDLLVPTTTRKLIEEGYLSPFRVFASSHPDLSKVRTIGGDYHEGDLSEAMSKPRLVADAVETWIKHGEGRPTLCFGVDRAHAKTLQRQFEEAGVSTEYIDAFTSREERKAIEKKFHNGTVDVVCNVGCLTTGVDWDVRCISLCRPTKSHMLFVQIIGRGLRNAEGKTDCLIFDHSDTHLNLGFVTDIHSDKLHDGSVRKSAVAEKQEPLPKACPSCGFLKPPKTHECPSCRFKPEVRSKLRCDDEELIEVTPGEQLEKITPADKASVYGQLKVYARRRGYNQNWADHKFREKFGHWPHKKQVPEVEPTPEVLSWIKHTQIRYAKRKGARLGFAA